MYIPRNGTNLMSKNCSFCRIEHEKLHAKHKGHEAMHMEMVLILFSTLIVAQVLLVKWKKHYYKSFQVTLIKTHLSVNYNLPALNFLFFVSQGIQF